MSEERTYPREWFACSRWGDAPRAEVFVRETAHCLYDSRGRKHSKRNSYERWYPTREEAQAVIDMRVKHEAERDAANRVRAAAPKLLEAAKAVVAWCDMPPHARVENPLEELLPLLRAAIAEYKGASNE